MLFILRKTFTWEKTLVKSENFGKHEFTIDFTIGNSGQNNQSFPPVKVLCNRPKEVEYVEGEKNEKKRGRGNKIIKAEEVGIHIHDMRNWADYDKNGDSEFEEAC